MNPQSLVLNSSSSPHSSFDAVGRASGGGCIKSGGSGHRGGGMERMAPVRIEGVGALLVFVTVSGLLVPVETSPSPHPAMEIRLRDRVEQVISGTAASPPSSPGLASSVKLPLVISNVTSPSISSPLQSPSQTSVTTIANKHGAPHLRSGLQMPTGGNLIVLLVAIVPMSFIALISVVRLGKWVVRLGRKQREEKAKRKAVLPTTEIRKASETNIKVGSQRCRFGFLGYNSPQTKTIGMNTSKIEDSSFLRPSYYCAYDQNLQLERAASTSLNLKPLALVEKCQLDISRLTLEKGLAISWFHASPSVSDTLALNLDASARTGSAKSTSSDAVPRAGVGVGNGSDGYGLGLNLGLNLPLGLPLPLPVPYQYPYRYSVYGSTREQDKEDVPLSIVSAELKVPLPRASVLANSVRANRSASWGGMEGGMERDKEKENGMPLKTPRRKTYVIRNWGGENECC